MTLQIIGTKKSSETRKAIRYCKEHSIPYQFMDLLRRRLSPGELTHILQYVDQEELVDKSSKYYINHGYAYLDYDLIEEILEHNELIRMPVIRTSLPVLVGFNQKTLDLIVED